MYFWFAWSCLCFYSTHVYLLFSKQNHTRLIMFCFFSNLLCVCFQPDHVSLGCSCQRWSGSEDMVLLRVSREIWTDLQLWAAGDTQTLPTSLRRDLHISLHLQRLQVSQHCQHLLKLWAGIRSREGKGLVITKKRKRNNAFKADKYMFVQLWKFHLIVKCSTEDITCRL